MKAGERAKATAIGLDEGGRGVTAEGLRVTDLLPGESAVALVEHVSEHRGGGAWGRIVERLSAPSPDRVDPACPAFGRCGGCAWQHLALLAQLGEKRAALERVLGRAVPSVRPSPSPLGYRNKGKYVVATDPLILGAHEPRSNRVVSTLGCRVVEPVIDAIATETRVLVEAAALTDGALRYVVVRSGCRDTATVTLVCRRGTSREALTSLAEAIAAGSSATGVLVADNDRSDGAVFDGHSEVLFGEGEVLEVLGGQTVGVDPNAFFQINRSQAELIYGRVGAILAVSGASQVLEAYAGVGAMGLAAAAAGLTVTTVEIDPRAVAVTERAAASAGVSVHAICGDAAAAIAGEFDAIIVNPPRRGLGDKVCAAIGAGRFEIVIYLSCGAKSLARDLAHLEAAGFTAASIEAFDMMPGTAHIESLVTLYRGRPE